MSKSTPLLEGTVIMADEQFAGRGQLDSEWHSEKGKNLTFSLLLNPHFLRVQDQFFLNMAISVGIFDAMSSYIPKGITIKWPNDIFVGHKKLGGILIENIIMGDRWKHAVIGIGLNVNQTEFPESLSNVTSISQILHKDYDLMKVLSDLCVSIEQRYLQLRNGMKKQLSMEYTSRMFLLSQWSLFRTEKGIHPGKIIGVTEAGMLHLETHDEILFLGNKEIEYLHNQ